MNSNKKIARIAGLLYLSVAVFSGFAAFVRSSLIVSGDTVTTVHNIIASEMLFRIGSVSDLIGQTFHVLLILALYELLKTVNRNQALLMAILALVPVPIACINMVNQFAVLNLLSGADYLKVFNLDQLHSQVMFFLNLHNYGVIVAQVFWGLWLFPLGFLVSKSVFIPKILGILLIVAGLGYLIDSFGIFLFSNYNITIAMFTFIGELSFIFWLLFKGVKVQPVQAV